MELADRLDVLRRSPVFEKLAEPELAALAEATAEWSFEAKDLLIRQGDPADSLWVMVAGTAEVRLRTKDETVVLAKIGPRDVFGEMALVTGGPRNADVAATSAGSALALTRDAFERIAVEHPEVFAVLTDLVAGRLGRAAQDGLADKVLEGYRIVRPIGRGATSVVYEAVETETGRPTALKMLSHRFSHDRDAMANHERESKLLEQVDHPAIAKSFGRFDAYGTRFLAIEYVDGPGLHEVIRVLGKLEVGDALAAAGSVAAALAHVHKRGIVHRDIKPANVILHRDGRVVLTDFGIAAHTAGGAGPSPRLSGTPRYMAPELFVGGKPNAGTDLYALGCVLYEMLQGTPVFGQPELGALVLAKRRFEPAQLFSMRADLPEASRTAIGRLLEPAPEDRPRDAGELGFPHAPVSSAVVADVLRRLSRETTPAT
jgi:CRP-like cAMP-binding protein